MNLENNTTREVSATVQFYYGVDVVFPEAVLKAAIYRFTIVFCHQIQVIYRFVDKRSLRQRKTEISTDGGTI